MSSIRARVLTLSVSRPWLLRLAFAVLAALGALLLQGGAAVAQNTNDDLGSGPANNGIAPDVTDSRGVPANRYIVLPQDRGGLDNLNKWLTGFFLDFFWQFATYGISMLLWMLRWVLSFEWVPALTKPFQDMAASFETATGSVIWIPFALTLSFIICAIAMMRGKAASGLMNIVLSCFIASAATGFLANPSTMILGPNGAVEQVAQRGGQIAVAVAGDGIDRNERLDSMKIINGTIAQPVIDVLIRQPAQLISYGKILSGPCETVFDEKMKSVPIANSGDNSVRDAVAACDPDVAAFIKYPFGQFVTAYVVGGAIGWLFFMAIGLTCILLLTVLWAAWQSIQMVWQLLLAILPTEDRSGLWRTSMDLLSALAYVGAAIVVLTLYMKLIAGLTTATRSLGVAQYLIINILFVGGILLFWVIRRKLKKTGEKMADRLRKLGLSQAQRKPPARLLPDLASLGRTYSDLKHLGGGGNSRNRIRQPAVGKTKDGPQPLPGNQNGPLALPAGGTFFMPGSGSMAAIGAGGQERTFGPMPIPSTGGPAAGGAATTSSALGALASAAMGAAASTPTPVGAAARAAMATKSAVETVKGATSAFSGSKGPLSPQNDSESLPPAKAAAIALPGRAAAFEHMNKSGGTANEEEVLTGTIVESSTGPSQPSQPVRSAKNVALRERLTSVAVKAAAPATLSS